MKKITLFIVCSFITIFVIAQSDFKIGYIITYDLDTISGLIDNNDYFDNSQYCDFKKSDNDSIVRYNPSDIFGYRFIDGKFYVSKKVNGIFLFMEFLIQGEVDIYFYQDKESYNHYYASKDTIKLVELKFEKGIKYVDNKQYYYEIKSYVGPLNYLTSDYPRLQADIQNLGEPDHKKLINLLKKYHEKVCDGEDCIIYEKKKSRIIKIYPQGGACVMFPIVSYSNKAEYSIIGGLQVLVQQIQWNEKYYVGLGFNYGAKLDGESVFQLPLSLNYIHPKNGINPYFGCDIDLLHPYLISYKTGVIYKKNKLSFSIIADLKTALFVMPIGSSINFGLNYPFG